MFSLVMSVLGRCPRRRDCGVKIRQRSERPCRDVRETGDDRAQRVRAEPSDVLSDDAAEATFGKAEPSR
jgi:hypothetical protein